MTSDRASPWVLSVILFYFVTQIFTLLRGQEPYPALLMPDFPGPGMPHADSVVLQRLAVSIIFEDHSEADVHLADLFYPFPEPAFPTLARHFRPTPGVRDPLPEKSGTGLLPGRSVRERRIRLRTDDPRLADWLTERAADLFPGRTPAVVHFLWIRSSYRPPGAEPESVLSVDTLSVALAPP